MEGSQIIEFISQYGYWIILPLMIIEGPIVTIIAAFLASAGVLDVFVVLFFSILGDVLGDIAFYVLGRKWGYTFVDKVGRHIGITHALVAKIEKYFTSHGGKTIFAVKSTTGLCWATFTAAGIAKMPFGKFIYYSVLGGIIWSVFLVGMGFFYGNLWAQITQYIKWAGWIIAGITVLTLIIVSLYKKRKSKAFFNRPKIVL